MAGIFALTTPDPAFDPDKPVRVNGFCFLPARRVLLARASRSAGHPSNPGGGDVTGSAARATPNKTDDGPGVTPADPVAPALT